MVFEIDGLNTPARHGQSDRAVVLVAPHEVTLIILKTMDGRPGVSAVVSTADAHALAAAIDDGAGEVKVSSKEGNGVSSGCGQTGEAYLMIDSSSRDKPTDVRFLHVDAGGAAQLSRALRFMPSE